MKHWIKLYVCTLRKDLSIILAVAILFIFVMDMWLKYSGAQRFFCSDGKFLVCFIHSLCIFIRILFFRRAL